MPITFKEFISSSMGAELAPVINQYLSTIDRARLTRTSRLYHFLFCGDGSEINFEYSSGQKIIDYLERTKTFSYPIEVRLLNYSTFDVEPILPFMQNVKHIVFIKPREFGTTMQHTIRGIETVKSNIKNKLGITWAENKLRIPQIKDSIGYTGLKETIQEKIVETSGRVTYAIKKSDLGMQVKKIIKSSEEDQYLGKYRNVCDDHGITTKFKKNAPLIYEILVKHENYRGQVHPSLFETFASAATLNKLTSIEFEGSSGITPEGLKQILNSDILNIQTLTMNYCVDVDILQTLSESSGALKLHTLKLQKMYQGFDYDNHQKICDMLGEAKNLSNLKSLTFAMGNTCFSPIISVLINSEVYKNLEHLKLTNLSLRTGHLKDLLIAPRLSNLKNLDLSDCYLSSGPCLDSPEHDENFQLTEENCHLSTLEVLDLSNTSNSFSHLSKYIDWHLAKNIKKIVLNTLDSDIDLIIKNEFFKNLEEIVMITQYKNDDLSNNRITALVKAKSLPKLKTVSIEDYIKYKTFDINSLRKS